MVGTTRFARPGLFGVFAATAAGGAVVVTLALPSASAAPSATTVTDPCAASEVARTIGSVATSTGSYLDAHPETNSALTTISQQQAGPQSLLSLKSYFDSNPQAASDIQSLQAPLVALSSRCKLPLTLPQIMGLMQTAQSQGGALAAAVPGGVPGATGPTAGTPGAIPRTAPRQGAGPLPGPAATSAASTTG